MLALWAVLMFVDLLLAYLSIFWFLVCCLVVGLLLGCLSISGRDMLPAPLK
jgi:hypothetical protein